ncbi:MAG: CRISPR-associated endoribonuclease Cas6 [Raineya sp.]|nr:CRISPR-associated endoribonuclease Cas6 [Raineya sp.]
MRFKITLSVDSKTKKYLPFNYQYELSSWIYKVIHQADEEYSYFLHQNGYQTDRKTFKLFCFSNFYIPKFKITTQAIELDCSEISFYITFYLDRASEKFVMGLFKNQKGGIGNKEHHLDFIVSYIEAKPFVWSGETLYLKTISPLVVGKKNEHNHDDYLPPNHSDFKDLFLNNLMDKYKATEQDIPLSWQDYPFDLQIHEPIKSKLITIKSNTEKPTQVKGYMFSFHLKAPKELLEVGLLAGFGKMNAQGFGACEMVEK